MLKLFLLRFRKVMAVLKKTYRCPFCSKIKEKSYFFEHFDGVFKVSRGNHVILKVNYLNNLYYLQCSTVDVEAVFIAFQKSDGSI
jgi:hypothetical protein